ncbi:MAG: FecR domain-containing protein [Pseudomonadota bacterium]
MAETDEAAAARIRDRAHAWRTLLEGGAATDDDRAAFDAWLAADPRHEEAYDRAVTVYAALGRLTPADYAAQHFQPLMRERALSLARVGRRFASRGGVLAALGGSAIVALAMLLLAPNGVFAPALAPHRAEAATQTFVTEKNEVREFRLSDGTALTLGADTRVETRYAESARSVTVIDGAALFDVVADAARPFVVEAGDLTATALGTVFEVRNSGGVHRVAVSEGEVAVAFPLFIGGRASAVTSRASLAAGRQVTAVSGEGLGRAGPIQADEVGAWRTKRLVYEGATIAELVADANRYDARSIVIAEGAEDLAELKLTGSFRGDNVDRMLLTLRDVHPIELDMAEPGVIRLRRRGAD